MAEPSIAVSRDIAAPAQQIFALLAQPRAHPDVDGSGMLRTTLDDMVITKAGDVFALHMYNDDLTDYVMENRVVEFIPGHRIVWEPSLRSVANPEYQYRVGVSYFHQWGWQLEPLDEGLTRVTGFFDCSRSPTFLQQAVNGGEGWRLALETSLENIERLVTVP